jgi:hypothetical protein
MQCAVDSASLHQSRRKASPDPPTEVLWVSSSSSGVTIFLGVYSAEQNNKQKEAIPAQSFD